MTLGCGHVPKYSWKEAVVCLGVLEASEYLAIFLA